MKTARFLAAVASAVVLGGQTARADLHTWDINEIFSNADGTIQFIEMQERGGLPGQHKLSSSTLFPNHWIKSNTQQKNFTTDLPSTATANKFFLIATAGFASLPGAVTPDYTMPNNFFSISGDTLNFSNGIDTFTFTGAQLPLNGKNSLQDNLTTPINSPRNFAGQQGSIDVPEPSTITLILLGAVCCYLTRRTKWLSRGMK